MLPRHSADNQLSAGATTPAAPAASTPPPDAVHTPWLLGPDAPCPPEQPSAHAFAIYRRAWLVPKRCFLGPYANTACIWDVWPTWSPMSVTCVARRAAPAGLLAGRLRSGLLAPVDPPAPAPDHDTTSRQHHSLLRGILPPAHTPRCNATVNSEHPLLLLYRPCPRCRPPPLPHTWSSLFGLGLAGRKPRLDLLSRRSGVTCYLAIPLPPANAEPGPAANAPPISDLAWFRRGPPPPRTLPGPMHSWIFVPLLHAAVGRLHPDALRAWESDLQYGALWSRALANLRLAGFVPPASVVHALHILQQLSEEGRPVPLPEAQLLLNMSGGAARCQPTLLCTFSGLGVSRCCPTDTSLLPRKKLCCMCFWGKRLHLS